VKDAEGKLLYSATGGETLLLERLSTALSQLQQSPNRGPPSETIRMVQEAITTLSHDVYWRHSHLPDDTTERKAGASLLNRLKTELKTLISGLETLLSYQDGNQQLNRRFDYWRDQFEIDTLPYIQSSLKKYDKMLEPRVETAMRPPRTQNQELRILVPKRPDMA
jgi:hypothetical protein